MKIEDSIFFESFLDELINFYIQRDEHMNKKVLLTFEKYLGLPKDINASRDEYMKHKEKLLSDEYFTNNYKNIYKQYGIYLKNKGLISFENFVNQFKNFHINHKAYNKFIGNNSTFFQGLYDLNNLLHVEHKKDPILCRCELLREISIRIHEYVISHIEEFEIFDEDIFVQLCPNFSNEYVEDVQFIEERLRALNLRMTCFEFINYQFYQTIYDACLFYSIHHFLIHTKDGVALNLREFTREYSPRNYPSELPYNLDGIVNYEEYCMKYDLNEEFEKEVKNVEAWRRRLLERHDGYYTRSTKSVIPKCIAHEMSILYKLDHPSDPLDPVAVAFDKLNKLFNKYHQNRKKPRDDDYEYNMKMAYRSAKSLIKKNADYEDYLKLGKFILSELDKDPDNYGLALYRFEKQYRLYANADIVNQLFDEEDDFMRTKKSIYSYYLEDIHFPNVRKYFQEMEDRETLKYCVFQFKSLLDFVTMANMLVIKGFIDKGYFGDDWYNFFLERLNKMAKSVLYDSNDINYSNSDNPNAQECFEQILTFRVKYPKHLRF